MPEMPSTGFAWQVDTDSLKGLFDVKAQYSPYLSQSRLVGAPGTKVFEIKVPEQASPQQKAIFRIVNARPWLFKGFGANFRAD